ncbi:hypothetical protein M0812_05227 [Anaeramoeba flamelloides]|uniref:HTH CENPB-type domain-containing protein n=1 Tax=Anaeramoeba flamelloides TaxID=1746091 RepID=A0AAV8A5P8_9EUKA|nr:hypothetical protein M0812_05227 [Anaeramoeba flamelloides]
MNEQAINPPQVDQGYIIEEDRNIPQDDQNGVSEEAINLGQDDQNITNGQVLCQDPQNYILTEEEIVELHQKRIGSIFEQATIVGQREIKQRNLVFRIFREYPKLMLISDDIEMIASAVCLCERKNIKPFSVKFIRRIFRINRGKIYRAKRAIKVGRKVGENGRPCLLNKAEEDYIVERLKILSLIGWAPTLDETVKIANEIITSWLQIDFKVQRQLITSNMWVHAFAKRNKLRITVSSPLEYQRIIVTEDLINRFLQTLKELYEEKNYVSDLIFNLDETSLQLNKNNKYSVITSETKKKHTEHKYQTGNILVQLLQFQQRVIV